MMDKLLKIDDIFGPVILSSGYNAGKLAYIIRLAGCSLSNICNWCTFTKWCTRNSGKEKTYKDIVNTLKALTSSINKRPMRIMITGGDIFAQNLEMLDTYLYNSFMTSSDDCYYPEIHLETQVINIPDYALNFGNHISFTLKGPSIITNGQDISALLDYYRRYVRLVNDGCEILDVYNRRAHTTIETKIIVYKEQDLPYMQNVFKSIIDIIKEDKYVKVYTNYSNLHRYQFSIEHMVKAYDVYNTFNAQSIAEYLYSNQCTLDEVFLEKVRILPQVDKILR